MWQFHWHSGEGGPILTLVYVFMLLYQKMSNTSQEIKFESEFILLFFFLPLLLILHMFLLRWMPHGEWKIKNDSCNLIFLSFSQSKLTLPPKIKEKQLYIYIKSANFLGDLPSLYSFSCQVWIGIGLIPPVTLRRLSGYMHVYMDDFFSLSVSSAFI